MLYLIAKRRALPIVIFIVAHMVVASKGGFADQPKIFGADTNPTELAEFLFSNSSEQNGSRSISQIETKSSDNVAALKILFEFDSTIISPDSLPIVKQLALALTTPQAGTSPVLIEGHTDATGEKIYNIRLSKRRAQAIKQHLVERYNIEPERLSVKGMGETELLNADFPTAAINRRVQIRRLRNESR